MNCKMDLLVSVLKQNIVPINAHQYDQTCSYNGTQSHEDYSGGLTAFEPSDRYHF